MIEFWIILSVSTTMLPGVLNAALLGIFQALAICALDNNDASSFSHVYTSLQPKEIFTDIMPNHRNDPLLARASEAQCSAEIISTTTQICEMLFFSELKFDQEVLCSEVYKKMRSCVLSKHSNCKTSSRTNSKVKRAVRKSLTYYYMEARYCNDGSLTPKPSLPINYCSVGYNEQVKICYSDYHRAFRKNITDEGLCEKYESAMICAQRTESDMCTYADLLRQVQIYSNNLYGCWNPFCVPAVNGFDVAITKKGLTFSNVRRMVESKLQFVSRKLGMISTSQEKIELKRGVPAKCQYNTAALIGTALVEIIDEMTNNQNDEQIAAVSTKAALETSLKPLANIGRNARRTIKDSGNSCDKISQSLFNVLQASIVGLLFIEHVPL